MRWSTASSGCLGGYLERGGGSDAIKGRTLLELLSVAKPRQAGCQLSIRREVDSMFMVTCSSCLDPALRLLMTVRATTDREDVPNPNLMTRLRVCRCNYQCGV